MRGESGGLPGRSYINVGVFRDKKSQAEKRADEAHVPVPAEEVARVATKVSKSLAEKEQKEGPLQERRVVRCGRSLGGEKGGVRNKLQVDRWQFTRVLSVMLTTNKPQSKKNSGRGATLRAARNAPRSSKAPPG